VKVIPGMDDDAMTAGLDLVGRSGARSLEVGYLHDDVPAERAGWYATAQFQGARVIVEDMPGPVEAIEGLARRLLTGAQCRCGGLVALSDAGAVVFGKAHLVDGSPWDAATSAGRAQCRWTRHGRRWVSACGAGTEQDRRPGRTPKRRRKGKRR